MLQPPEFNWIDLIWIIALVVGGRTGLRLLVRRARRAVDDGDPRTDSGKEKRVRTIGRVVYTMGSIVIWGVALLTFLRMFGVNITPILAAGGIFGVAIGLGSQSFAKDFVSGMVILLENQYAEGDRVKIGAYEGRVHRMTVRSTILEDDDGNLVFLSNGDVAAVVNYSLGSSGRPAEGAK